ncbi:hypothetical protein [Moorena sp. SIO2C4]|uniref:hypothetical protein n=1 Tax=Moorena sp. SIO2C4 TaxID=2607824 RepID=UPI0013C9BB37|nr:hypothetical protein [Moorena sp. SIO2C4]NES40525.1 hypothetical protein [Moorena sp. SIO2C4]
MSRPVLMAIEKGILTKSMSIFDYGCGYGTDMDLLKDMGYLNVNRYDPYYFPDQELVPSSLVFLNYVISVIENLPERDHVLLDALSLASDFLIVALLHGKHNEQYMSKYHCKYMDGIINKTFGSFTKSFSQEEASSYIMAVSGYHPESIGQGIFLIDKSYEPILPPVNLYSEYTVQALYRLTKTLKKRINKLSRKWILPDGVTIQVYKKGNDNQHCYYRLVSRKKFLCHIGDPKMLKSKHLGRPSSTAYHEAVNALGRKIEIAVLLARISHIKSVIKFLLNKPKATKTMRCTIPGFIPDIL